MSYTLAYNVLELKIIVYPDKYVMRRTIIFTPSLHSNRGYSQLRGGDSNKTYKIFIYIISFNLAVPRFFKNISFNLYTTSQPSTPTLKPPPPQNTLIDFIV